MESRELSDIQRTGIFITLLSATFVTSMSTTVTANMIPNFTSYFSVSVNLAQWLTSGATLISGITIPVTAFLIKRLSNRRYFIMAITAFTAGSLLVFSAQSFRLLLVSRLVQAVGCGMMIPFGQIMLMRIYPVSRHGRVISAFSMASMLSAVVGPTYAGLMLEAAGWRGVFLSLFILGCIILVLGCMFMKNVTVKSRADLNVAFVLLSAAGFSMILIGISNTGSRSFFDPLSGGLMIAGTAAAAVFTVLQLRSEKPMLNLRVFCEPSFLIATVISVCLYLISMGTGMILPIFTKTICGFSDSAYGYATIAGSIMSLLATLYAGKVYDRRGIKPMFLAGIIVYSAYSAMGICFTEHTGIIYIAAAFALQTVAMSLINSPATTMALSRLKGNERIDGSAVFNTLRQISSSLASTLSVLIYTLAGSDMNAVRTVYVYYSAVTAVIALSFLLYLRYMKGFKNE